MKHKVLKADDGREHHPFRQTAPSHSEVSHGHLNNPQEERKIWKSPRTTDVLLTTKGIQFSSENTEVRIGWDPVPQVWEDRPRILQAAKTP